MKSGLKEYPLLVWAARDILRRPGRGLLVSACLASVSFLIAVALLFSQAMETTWNQLMVQAPDLIVRRINAGGWAPMPAETAVAAAASVPGALTPTPRLWGVATGPRGPVTVVASPGVIPETILQGLTPPVSGQAVVGRGVVETLQDGRLILVGQERLQLTIVGTFPAQTCLATHDLVWMAPNDARRLLGLLPGEASDLAVSLFHEEEEPAIQADLADAFPWPVHITGRSDGVLRHHQRAVHRGGISVVACVPAILALVWIVAGTAATGSSRQAHWGLLKSLGWTTGDLVRLQIFQAALLGTPALAAGLASAYSVVFYPPAAGIAAWWLTGGQHLPALVLSRSGALIALLEISALVIIPYLAAVFLATVKQVANEPWHLLMADPWN
ncbi:hypothetical protein DSCW_46970 [Desulfosarcina widdelii]|uniref:ABC transporter permease n=1 Tax=Desulfosarcina widdelii TaxID=947919 RepID=A0A5K7Z929_9BACT|nr:hypothetical protein [Desulfosarcina widdelii]BBO77280.1 hypothetical protein DSCW_46970 [Desulfosarcina widdelii]